MDLNQNIKTWALPTCLGDNLWEYILDMRLKVLALEIDEPKKDELLRLLEAEDKREEMELYFEFVGMKGYISIPAYRAYVANLEKQKILRGQLKQI